MNRIAVTINGHTYEIEVGRERESVQVRIFCIDGQEVDEPYVPVYIPELSRAGQIDWMIVEDRPYELSFDHDLHWVQAYSGRHPLDVRDLSVAVAPPASGDGRVKAPIPGLIAQLLVEPGDHVEPGTPVLILEAMKMENEIQAPRGGTVAQINVENGQTVTLNELLIEIE
jgi:biotin carboxyl carrier protein